MAISRRLILKLGVSYGTGAINFGNDSVAYDRELRGLPENTVFAAFLETLREAEERLIAATSETEEALAEESSDTKEEAVDSQDSEVPVVPLDDVIEKARAFQELCAKLALSEMYVQMRSIIEALLSGALPSPDEIEHLKTDYARLIEYLQNC